MLYRSYVLFGELCLNQQGVARALKLFPSRLLTSNNSLAHTYLGLLNYC